jgi:glycosyltransferase involved in cell wall biosynthesis
MATVFSTNANVFTAQDVTPLRHRVISWGWRDDSQSPGGQRKAMADATRWTLRRFPDADALASAYHQHKVLLAQGGVRATLRAAAWVVRGVRSSDRLLLASPPGGVDRVLWLAAYLAGRLSGVPIYLYSEVWIEPLGLRHWLNRWLLRRLCQDASRILVPSDVHRTWLIALGVSPNRIDLIESIYCPTPELSQLLPARAGTAKRPFTFLYVGRMVPCKGLARLLVLVDQILRGHHARLVVVAAKAEQFMGADAAYPARCRRLIESLPADRIELIEHVDDVDPIYERADVLVMPNVVVRRDKVPGDSWGRVVEEALYHRVPVVSTDAVPAARQLVADGVNGHIVPWAEDARLVAALASVATSSRLDGR